MSSGGSLGALQRLVEQLKLEAAVERIKDVVCGLLGGYFEKIDRHHGAGRLWDRSLRQLQNSSSTACKMPAKMPCLLEFLQGAIPFENPDPVLSSEIREGHQRAAFKDDMNNNCLPFPRKDLLLCG